MSQMPKRFENTGIELRYSGHSVDNGRMPIEYMVDALVGFSSAYGRVSRRSDAADLSHTLRVVGLKKGSSRILIEVFEYVTKNPAAAGVLLTGATTVGTAATYGLKIIAGVIRGKKHLAGQPVTNNYTFNGSRVVIINQTGGELELNKDQFEYLQSGLLDSDLDKLTAPLEEGQVDEFELTSDKESLAKVEARDRPYFVHEATTVTTTRIM